MFIKNQSTWERNINYEEATVFKSLLDKLKTYSKCFNSSTYSVTSTLSDVYDNIKYQHALWIQLTEFAPDTLTLFGLEIKKGTFYNLLKHVDTQTILDSVEFRTYLQTGWIKASNSLLFEDIESPSRKDWFCFYEPRRVNQYINQPFDYLVIRYNLKDPAERDIDTRTAFVNTGYQGKYFKDFFVYDSSVTPIDGSEVGWARGSNIGSTSGIPFTIGEPYLQWGGDNTTSVGGESILIDFKQIGTDLSYLTDIQVRLRAFFYAVKASGKIELELATYKGGSMIHVGTDFQNVGGVSVQSIKSDRTILTQTSSNNNGDDLGTIIFNIENSNAILTDLLNTFIINNNLTFTDLLNTIDFTKFEWQMGTSGYSATDPNYTDMLIPYNFTNEDLMKEFQHSYDEWGYTERNLFTSEKVWKKLLNHFYIIDIATTTNIEITDINKNPLPYPIIDIDGIRLVNGHKVLFKDQTNSSDNGVYSYNNSVFTRDEIFNSDEDLTYFSCFIKEGSVNKNKEFFLNRKEDGKFPTFEADTCGCKCGCNDSTITCPHFVFEEGNNYVLRNRSSYKLLADHIFTDSDYFVQAEPITPFDYTNRRFDSLSGTSFYAVNKEFNKFEYLVNNEVLYTNKAGTNAFDKLLPRIEVQSSKMYLLRNQNELVKFVNFTTIPNKDIFNSVVFLPSVYSDFQLTSASSGYFLKDNSNSTQGFSIVNKFTFINSVLTLNNTLKLNENAKELRVLNNTYFFYTTFNGVYLNWNNNNFKIRDVDFPTSLRIAKNGTTIEISYIVNDTPQILDIEESELVNLLSWTKNEDYEIKKFSKFNIDTWNIASTAGMNNLYLKGTQITNLAGTNYFINVPKIQKSNSRYFDGIDDYSDLNIAYNYTTNQTYFNRNISLSTLANSQVSQGSFTLEFKITPEEIRVNQTPIYFGNKSTIYTFRFGKFRYQIPLKPNDYMSFGLNSGDGFPMFTIKKGSKQLTIKSNQKLIVNTEAHISFVWNYTANKASGELYFDGVLVGSYIDQKTTTNLPIDVRTISYDKSFFGKSEIVTSPAFKGNMREVRLWKKALNSSQIFTRLDKDINKDNENFIADLIGYWKLNDDKSINYNLAQGNNFYKATNEKLSDAGAGIFVGGLNNDTLLREIQNPQLIQLSDKFLYVSDKKSYETYSNNLNAPSSSYKFFNQGTAGVQLLTDPSGQSTSKYTYVDLICKSLKSDITSSNRWGVLQTIQPNDVLDIEVETYYAYSATSGNSTGGGLSVIYGTNGFNLNFNAVTAWNLVPNQWNKLQLSYTAQSGITNIGFDLHVDNNPAYFRNLKYKISRANDVYNVYKIDLFKERVTKIRNSYQIDSIYYELNNPTAKFYTLEANKVYSYNNTAFSSLPVNIFANVATDFAVINNKYFYLDNANKIWDSNTQVYTESSSFNIETIYGFDDSRINKTVLYSKGINQDINILSRNTSALNTALNFIATYPLPTNNSASFTITSGSNSVVKLLNIKNNDVYFNNILVDTTNKNWNFNKQTILGIFKKNDNYGFVLSKTLANEVQLWIFNTNTGEITKVANYLNDTTLFISENESINLQYYTIDKGAYFDEWIVINDKNDVYFYQLEKMNKVNYKKSVQELEINTSKTITNIFKSSDTNIWMELMLGNTEFISTFTNTSNAYDLWEDTLKFSNIETGWLIGESGILFEDVTNKGSNGTAFALDFINIVYKDDLSAIDAIKTKVNRDKGYKVTEWSGIVYMVGDLGRVIKTSDNGTSWKVLTTNNYNDFKGVSFFTDKEGLIVGLNNTILATFSGGDTFVPVVIPESIGIRDWFDVKFYDTNKAIVVGSLGTMIHLSKNNFDWTVDKILNNIPLSELEVSIKSSDLDDVIKLTINKGEDSDLYRQTIRKIEPLGNNEFLLSGDNNLLSHLRLSPQIGYIIPYINFLQSNENSDWVDIISYDDIVRNEKRAFIVKNNQIYSFEWNRFNQNDDINIESVEVQLVELNTEIIKTIDLGNNSLIYGGRRVTSAKKRLFDYNEDEFIYVEQVINPTFRSNGMDWAQFNANQTWTFNNNATVTVSTSTIADSKLLYTQVDLDLNKTYTFDYNFVIPSGSYMQIVYADTLANLLSGSYVLDTAYSFPVSPFTMNNTSGIAYIGFIAHTFLNTPAVFTINSVSVIEDVLLHNQAITYSEYKEKEDLSSIFKPRMLFLDYYMGRKINIHLENGNFVSPSGELDKLKLQCYYFRDGEYIEFTDYGTVDSQNNYLAYQDHYMLNRRILDQPNSWGKTQMPYNKYNKRMTSIDDYMTHAIWEGELSTHGTNSAGNGYQFSNEAVTDLAFYNIGDLREDSHATKLRLAWNNTTDTYSTTGLVTQSIIIFSDSIVDLNVHRYTFRTTTLLGLKKGDLVKLDFSDTLYYVNKEYVSSGNKYLDVDGLTIPTPNYTGKITKVSLNFMETVKKGDVINIISLDKDRNVELTLGDKIYLEINAHNVIIQDTAIVQLKDINIYSLVFSFEEFDTTFEVEFGKGSTIDEVLLELRKEDSAPVQIANAILEKRCFTSEESKFRVVELNVFNFLSTYKTITDIIVNPDNNKMYATTLDKKLFVIDIDDNSVDTIIPLSTPSKYITYSPFFKYLYITGGDPINKNVDVVNTITNTKIGTINVGDMTIKALYNPHNKYMYVPTNGNKCVLFNGLTQASSIPTKFNDMVFVSFNNYVYTISTDNFVRVYDGATLKNTINVGANLLKMVYDAGENKVFITSTTGVYVLNVTNNIVDFISVPKGIVYTTGVEMVDIKNGNNIKKALFVTNANLADTNFYITVIDRVNKNVVKEIYTDISVKDIKYNPKENLIYLGGKTGQIAIINPLFDLNEMDVNLDIDLYNIQSGQISSLVYNEINFRIYPVKTQTYEISYLLTDKLEPSNISINLNSLTADITTVVRDVTPDNKVTLWDLFTDEMVYEMNAVDKKLIVKNLNYFDGDLLTLKTNFDKHLLGNSYNLTINREDKIYIDGSVNDLTKYYNLETYVRYATFGTNSSMSIETIPVKYSDDIIYGANYSILSFLKKLNPVFDENYTFNLPTHSYTYEPLIRTALGEYKEFSIMKNKIYIGNDLINIVDFHAGIFVDITNNSKSVTRVYIKSIEESTYVDYPDKKRWIITTDKALETNLDLTGTVTLRGRNKLIEISRDLEFTDDLMFPISNGGSNAVTLANNTYYNNQVTSFEYAKILLDDDNVRRYVSSVVHLDKESDWNISVINWKDDPNFFYRPLELFEVGVDRVFKKAITIDSSNYLIKGNTLELMNVDLNKYNYRIVDGMTLKELEEKYYWVLNADIRNAIIGESTSGFVWYTGDWIAGTWEAGTWYSGKAYDIEWIKGDVYSNLAVNNFNLISTIDNGDATNTIWYKAVWGTGNWFNGTWNDGIWYNGQFNGVWNNGTWTKGIWNGGNFQGGSWLSGTWLSGTFSQNNSFSVWYSGTWLGGDFENGTWKTGIFDQTDRMPSRFGTKATLLNSAVWEYGWWKNGEFHSGLNIDPVTGTTLPSTNYKYSKWYNGTWEKGVFYGGQWELGIWKNGILENGYFKSNLEIKEWRVRTSDINLAGKMVEVEFTSPHYYKDLAIGTDDLGNTIKLQNYFILLGEPEITKGQIHPNTELLGYNTSAGKHEIIDIIDDKTILISIPDENYPYEITEGTSGYINTLDLSFEAGTNYLIDNVSYNNKFGTAKERLIYANDNLTMLRPYNNNTVKNYTWGSKTPTISTLSIAKPADVLWHRKSDKTFITSGYDNASFINTTKLSVEKNGIVTTPLTGLTGANFLTYDNVYDNIIVTSRCLVDSASSGNANKIYFVNPYNYTNTSLTIGNLNSHTVNKAVMSEPYVQDGTSFYSIQYQQTIPFFFFFTITVVRSSLLRIDNNTKTLSQAYLNPNSTTVLEGFDRHRNKLILKRSVGSVTSLVEKDTMFNNEIAITSSTSGHFFSKYLENKNELFIVNDNKLYTWDGSLKKIATLASNVNSIVWSDEFNAYFIASNGGVWALSADKKNILYHYNIPNALEFSINPKDSDKIYITSNSQLYLIMNDVCKFACTDYSVFKPVIEDSVSFDIDKFQYKGEPHIASHWINGKFRRGIFEYGYWVNGLWQGGIWLDGVYENGVFGTE